MLASQCFLLFLLRILRINVVVVVVVVTAADLSNGIVELVAPHLLTVFSVK
jgi:hypothetical protein